MSILLAMKARDSSCLRQLLANGALIVIIGLLPACGQAEPVDACEIPNKLSVRDLPKWNSVVLLGEVHFVTPLESIKYLLSEFAKNSASGACLAVEFSKEERAFETVLDEFKSRASVIRNDPSPFAQKVAANFEDAVRYYGQVNRIAKSQNLTVVPVDHPEKAIRAVSIDERNRAIADNLSDLIRSGECSRIIGLFGKAHLSIGMLRTTNIRDLVQKKDISVISINMQMTNEKGIDESAKSVDLGCRPRKKTETFSLILNKDLPLKVSLFPRIAGETSTFQHFDYTLFIPTTLAPLSLTFPKGQ